MNNRIRKPPKPMTPDRLHNAALAYMARFSTTAENLRRVLARRIARAEGLEPEAKATLTAHVATLIARYQALGYLDDAAYVQSKVASLRRGGASARTITFKLRSKGAAADTVETELEEVEEKDPDAAWIFARRKRLGPYRATEKRGDFRQKDMAAMGRAGFDYSTARAVIDAPDADAER